MRLSISDPLVRKAIYTAYKGQCFFTGRIISEQEMVIDHLIPRSKGGEDVFENFVLTYKDLNLGKSCKLDDELKRMQWTVKNVFAPRAQKIFEKMNKNIQLRVGDEEEVKVITLKKFKTKVSPPSDLAAIKNKDLFWVKDHKITVLTSLVESTDLDPYEIDRNIEICTKSATDNECDYCNEIWLTPKEATKLKSIWYNVDGQSFKVIKSIKYYDDLWAYVYFTRQYLQFVRWKEEINDALEQIFQIEDHDNYDKQLKRFCRYFPRPYWPPIDENKK